jgi:hypothetical protein
MQIRHIIVAAVVMLAAGSAPADLAAQEWCSKAARKLCGIGSNEYPGQFTGTIHMNSTLTGPEFARSAIYVITLKGDGTASCSGTVRGTGINETLNHEAHVTIHMDAWTSARRAGGEYGLGAFCAEDLMWHEEYVSVDARTTSFSSLTGQVTQAHPSTDPDNGMSGTQSIRWKLSAPPPRRR